MAAAWLSWITCWASNLKVAKPWLDSDAVAHCCDLALEKTLNAVSHFGTRQPTCYGGPAWRKPCKQSQLLC